jgi:hypothetical protein
MTIKEPKPIRLKMWTYRNSKRFQNINIKILRSSFNHKRLHGAVIREARANQKVLVRILEEGKNRICRVKIMSLGGKEGWSSGGCHCWV